MTQCSRRTRERWRYLTVEGESELVLGSFELTSTMHQFLLPQFPRLEERLRNDSDAEEKEMPGVSGVDF